MMSISRSSLLLSLLLSLDFTTIFVETHNYEFKVHDYIHVVNLADGHTAALKKLSDHKIGCEVYNLGTGKGTSALEMVVAFEKASGKRNWMTSQSKGFHLRISRLFLFKKIRAFIKKPSIAVDDSIFKGPNQCQRV
ncbi:unnamed protein product [Lactuca saligna]|uniref:UDP-glucose 4-epimerase n=1 Tax=Lactuca saligna TaxID=75948 RepID=A0AA35VY21_LACSI|nr:unnamed protein product [Lactuca saligna]